MGIYVVTGSFQFRGGMWRTGQQLSLTEGEARDNFVAAHVRPVEAGEEGRPRPAPVLSNGTEKKRPEGNRPKRTGLELV